HRAITGGAFMILALASVGLIAVIGQNFFPYVDAGQMRLHVRCPTGTRIEEASAIFASIEKKIRQVIPAQELDSILDNIGLQNDGIYFGFTHLQERLNRFSRPPHSTTLQFTAYPRSLLKIANF